MKTYVILFVIVSLLHTMNLVHETMLGGAWGGIVMMISTILFVIGVYFFGIEYRLHKKRRV
ncbi:hypothetical protein [Alteribacter aurantiacus]|uniref:hypothetical protein n=1 Tax=Alteribacter aurantiacus TaxID=254410 RepID=UPI00042775F3|nr:hypothetical protein [Alteribacter aurantiacus]